MERYALSRRALQKPSAAFDVQTQTRNPEPHEHVLANLELLLFMVSAAGCY